MQTEVKVVDGEPLPLGGLELTNILHLDETKTTVLRHLAENWPKWAVDVRHLDAAVWMPWCGREGVWWLWLQGISATRTFQEIVDFTDAVASVPGWVDFINFIQAYTNTTTLDRKHTSPLTRGILTHGSHVTHNQHMWGDVVSAEFFLLFTDTDPTVMENSALRSASTNGKTALVELLLKDERMMPMMVLLSSPNVRRYSSIHFAADNGHADIVELLIDAGADPSSEDDLALRVASSAGHTDVVRLLLEQKQVDPSALHNWALQAAIAHGHAGVLTLLLNCPKVDPDVGTRSAIITAHKENHRDVLDILRSCQRTPTIDKWVLEELADSDRYMHPYINSRIESLKPLSLLVNLDVNDKSQFKVDL